MSKIIEHKEWKNRVSEILGEISIPWELHLKEDEVYKDVSNNGRLYIQIQFDDVNNIDGTPYRSHCRKWYLSPHMTDQEVVRTAWKAYEGAVIHEASEKFLYGGKMIYGPHICPESLWNIAQNVEHRKDEV